MLRVVCDNCGIIIDPAELLGVPIVPNDLHYCAKCLQAERRDYAQPANRA